MCASLLLVAPNYSHCLVHDVILRLATIAGVRVLVVFRDTNFPVGLNFVPGAARDVDYSRHCREIGLDIIPGRHISYLRRVINVFVAILMIALAPFDASPGTAGLVSLSISKKIATTVQLACQPCRKYRVRPTRGSFFVARLVQEEGSNNVCTFWFGTGW